MRSRKHIIFLFFIGSCLSSFSQKTLNNNGESLLFKESYYYFPISRTLYDTAIIYSGYETGKTTIIEQYSATGFSSSHGLNFLPIIFFGNKDSICYKYNDPANAKGDTTICKLFHLNFNDTILSAFCYKISVDSFYYDSGSKKTLQIVTNCENDDRKIKTYRKQDTLIKYKDYELDCYVFEQKSLVGHYRDVYFTRVITVEKRTLIPVDVKEYDFYTEKRSVYRNIDKNKHLLTYHQKLIGIQ